MEEVKSIFKDTDLLKDLTNNRKRLSTRLKLIMQAEGVSLDKLASLTDIDSKMLARILDSKVYPISSGRKALRLADYFNITSVLQVPNTLVVNMLGIPAYVKKDFHEIGYFFDLYAPMQAMSKKKLAQKIGVTSQTIYRISVDNAYSRLEESAVIVIIKMAKILKPILDETEPFYFIQKYLFEQHKTKAEIVNGYKLNATILSHLFLNCPSKVSLKKYGEVMTKLGFNDYQALQSLGMDGMSANYKIAEFGTYVKESLYKKGFWQKDFAESIGMSEQGIAYIIRTSGVSIENAVRIANVIDSIDDHSRDGMKPRSIQLKEQFMDSLKK